MPTFILPMSVIDSSSHLATQSRNLEVTWDYIGFMYPCIPLAVRFYFLFLNICKFVLRSALLSMLPSAPTPEDILSILFCPSLLFSNWCHRRHHLFFLAACISGEEHVASWEAPAESWNTGGRGVLSPLLISLTPSTLLKTTFS